jgi:hypothetical protein
VLVDGRERRAEQPVITLHASGGLGNQLFNYAAARTLADLRQTNLILDLDSYRDTWAPGAYPPFLLHHFPIRAIFRHFGPERPSRSIWTRTRRWLREDAFTRKLSRDALGYFEDFEDLPARTILYDHYISPRFFEANADRIRKDLSLTDAVLGADAKALQLLDAIRRSPCAVAIHVRRGELLNPEHYRLRLPDIENYYAKAMAIVADRIPQPSFFVFSDDPEWCVNNLGRLPYHTTYAGDRESPRANPLSDFYLMSQCRSFIVANSAFSWWAAWLSPQQDKTVLTPHLFDTGNLLSMDDLIPPSWTRVHW